MENLPTPFPTELKKVASDLLGIQWSDGANLSYSVRELRLSCRCAHCVDEWTREPKLDPQSVPADVVPTKIDSVGRYALRIVWSDGHDTGIYTFHHLRELGQAGDLERRP